MSTAKSEEPPVWGEEDLGRTGQRRRKRDAILRTAAQAFCANGFHQTSLNDIADKLNVTKPSLYYYVKSKDDILFECHREALEQLRDPLDTAERGAYSGRERLRIFMTAYAKTVCGDFGRCLILCTDQVLRPDLRDELWGYRRRLDSAVRKIIQEGIDDGSIAPCDPKYATFAIFGAFNWLAHWFEEDGSVDPAQVADMFLNLFENGLIPRTG